MSLTGNPNCRETAEAQRPGRIPYTGGLTTRFAGLVRIGGRMPDVYDPAWVSRLDAEFAAAAARHRDDPWLIGYFSDNELPWHQLAIGGLLAGPGDGPARSEFVRRMRERYRDGLADFNREWGASCVVWDDLRSLPPAAVPHQGPAAAAMADFAADYAERYFSTVATTIRRHDPGHLYLGCRFVRNAPHPDICAAAGRHCDVISVNSYALWPDEAQFQAWHELTGGRPIQIGEFNLPLVSPRMVPSPWPCFSEEERRSRWPGFLRRWVDQPWSVGSHFFQFLDMAGTGRPFADAGNGADSLIDITDTPHPDVVAAMRTIGESFYAWRE